MLCSSTQLKCASRSSTSAFSSHQKGGLSRFKSCGVWKEKRRRSRVGLAIVRYTTVGVEPAADVPKSNWNGFSWATSFFFSSMPIAAWNLRSMGETSPRYRLLMPSTWNCAHIMDCGCNVAASVRKSATCTQGYCTSARSSSTTSRPLALWSPFGVTMILYWYRPRQSGLNVMSKSSVHRPATCPSERPSCKACAPASCESSESSDSS
mmetsp:Transcript_48962/g.149043  ORF Transcript_48962/g.149043 Transcript_48962/m.149043 type:complete len:208 (+) Transcript_48962:1215-1838(+)